jgi:hypothetical protein
VTVVNKAEPAHTRPCGARLRAAWAHNSTISRHKPEGECEWHTGKHGGSKRRQWRKIHLGVDEQTLEIRAIEITGSQIGDAPMLPDLLGQIPADV